MRIGSEEWCRLMKPEDDAWEKLYRLERARIRDDRLITIISFLLCIPIGWLVSRIAQ